MKHHQIDRHMLKHFKYLLDKLSSYQVGTGTLLDQGALPRYISQSLSRLGLGAVLATAIGVPIGLLLGASRYGAMMFGPFLRFFQAVSGIALLPLALVWFGFTETTIQVSVKPVPGEQNTANNSAEYPVIFSYPGG